MNGNDSGKWGEDRGLPGPVNIAHKNLRMRAVECGLVVVATTFLARPAPDHPETMLFHIAPEFLEHASREEKYELVRMSRLWLEHFEKQLEKNEV